ncbi:MAG: hypothetical protein IMZ57_02265 [Acidobacteria bacterium]|nr:hypothetical protein [Acidobacteriota bacterium]
MKTPLRVGVDDECRVLDATGAVVADFVSHKEAAEAIRKINNFSRLWGALRALANAYAGQPYPGNLLQGTCAYHESLDALEEAKK